jgi:glycine cleavage system H protein
MSTNVPNELLYTESHEWVRLEGDIATVGITDHAQSELGDIVDFDAPDVGDELEKGDDLGAIESVKVASDIYAPVSGEIVEVNEDISDSPESVNDDPYGKGWLVKIKVSNAGELEGLLNATLYGESIA